MFRPSGAIEQSWLIKLFWMIAASGETETYCLERLDVPGPCEVFWTMEPSWRVVYIRSLARKTMVIKPRLVKRKSKQWKRQKWSWPMNPCYVAWLQSVPMSCCKWTDSVVSCITCTYVNAIEHQAGIRQQPLLIETCWLKGWKALPRTSMNGPTFSDRSCVNGGLIDELFWMMERRKLPLAKQNCWRIFDLSLGW